MKFELWHSHARSRKAALNAMVAHRNVLSKVLKSRRPGKSVDNLNSGCLLFKLSGEIRNRIYSLVLGGKVVHIQGREPRTNPSELTIQQHVRPLICQHPYSELEATKIEADRSHYRHFRTDPHEHCWHSNQDVEPDPMNLRLLLVCRQIHDEAALIPFAENRFWFNRIIILQAFLEFLSPDQVGAVKEMCFLWHPFHGDPTFERRLGSKMSGVRSLVVAVKHLDLQMGDCLELTTRDLLHLKSIPASNVTVAGYGMTRDYADAERDGLVKWATCLALYLLQDWRGQKMARDKR